MGTANSEQLVSIVTVWQWRIQKPLLHLTVRRRVPTPLFIGFGFFLAVSRRCRSVIMWEYIALSPALLVPLALLG
jgi:hypothetical protein